jgi:transcriptional regulator with XRE-family HTH domain
MPTSKDFKKSMFYIAVGERLREVRKESGLSIDKLAEECGVSRSTVSSAESGNSLSLYLITLFAEKLDTTLDALVPLDALDAVKSCFPLA